MKKLLIPAVAVMSLLSCNNETDKGKFTVNGQLKGAADQKIYLEELSFGQKDPEVLDTGEIKNGKFSIGAIGVEEGLYRLRLEKNEATYIFTNDKNKIDFAGDDNNTELQGWNFSGAANSSLKRIMAYADSSKAAANVTYTAIMNLTEAKVSETDSAFVALNTTFNSQKEALTKYCYRYADTAANPIVALFAATMAPVEMDKFVIPIEKLATRFPNHKGIAGAVSYIKTETARQQQQALQPQQSSSIAIGSIAPEITMDDVNGKPFSLSQLRGKYVLIDFWASWCGPCRGENPNVVSAYNKFKDKNFTVLGVSLDDNKASWIQAIADDHLTWTHISDLKKWYSDVVGSYGFDGIPYNVLIDPQGKIIARELRGEALEAKLAEAIK